MSVLLNAFGTVSMSNVMTSDDEVENARLALENLNIAFRFNLALSYSKIRTLHYALAF